VGFPSLPSFWTPIYNVPGNAVTIWAMVSDGTIAPSNLNQLDKNLRNHAIPLSLMWHDVSILGENITAKIEAIVLCVYCLLSQAEVLGFLYHLLNLWEQDHSKLLPHCPRQLLNRPRLPKMHAKALTCFNFFNFRPVSTKFPINIKNVILTNRMVFVFRIATFLAGKWRHKFGGKKLTASYC
jgi:hypothetical protein